MDGYNYIKWLEPTKPTTDQAGDFDRESQRRYWLNVACSVDVEFRKWIYDKCSDDPWFWATNFVWLSHPSYGVAPMLAYGFQYELMMQFLGIDGWKTPLGRRYSMGVYKTREVGGSALACAAAIYEFVFRPHTTSAFASKSKQSVDDGSDAFAATLFGKLRHILTSLPIWMRPTPWQGSDKPKFFDKNSILVNPDNGASILGFCSSMDSLRSARASRVYIDEANSLDNLEAIMAASASVGPTAMISSVTSRNTPFAKYVHGEIAKLCEKKGGRGMIIKKLHYSMLPQFDQSTEIGRERILEMKETLGLSERQWQAEYEANFLAAEEGLFWAQSWNQKYEISDIDYINDWVPIINNGLQIIAWDFGGGKSATVAIVAYYFPETGKILVDDYFVWHYELAEDVVSDITSAGYYANGRNPDYSIGDPSGKAPPPRVWGGQKINVTQSWLQRLKDLGVVVSGQAIREISAATSLVTKYMNDGKILLSPKCRRPLDKYPNDPSVLAAINGYKRRPVFAKDDEDANHEAKPLKDRFSHLADALQHIVWRVSKL